MREAPATSFDSLHTARLNMNYESFRKITEVLPWESSNMTIAELYYCLANAASVRVRVDLRAQAEL